jgi:NADP-dependent 3-hydroxy acid dehydrogenase YdfG
MDKTLAVIGAGPGIGLAVARAFGQNGFRVALLARRADKLDDYVSQLASEGVDAAPYRADVTDRAGLAGALEQAADALGGIDVMEYSPAPAPETLAMPRDITVDNAQLHLDYAVLGAITAVRAVLPAMAERGDGGLLFTTAVSAVSPVPFSSNFGLANAGLRSYVHSLNASLAPEGVYAGIVEIAGVINKGGTEEELPPELEAARTMGMSVIPAREVADVLWDMYTKRDRIEQVVGDEEAVHRLVGTAGEPEAEGS